MKISEGCLREQLGSLVNPESRFIVIIVILCVLLGMKSFGGEVWTSDDKKCLVRIADAVGAEQSDLNREIEISVDGRILARLRTIGYLMDVKWSQSGEFVAINNRRASSGDYLWVVSLSNGQVIRKPDDPFRFRPSVFVSSSEYGSDSDVFRMFIIANRWDSDGSLLVERSFSYKDKNNTVIEHLVCEVSEGELWVKAARVSNRQR
jgi:hypothetical protein